MSPASLRSAAICRWPCAALVFVVLGSPAHGADPPASADPSAAPAMLPASQPAPRPPERMELDTTSIRGNQELPKVLYIVPWKDPGLGEPDGRPLGSLIDEALAPVDRDVFRRQMRYFDQLYARPRDPGVESPAPADD